MQQPPNTRTVGDYVRTFANTFRLIGLVSWHFKTIRKTFPYCYPTTLLITAQQKKIVVVAGDSLKRLLLNRPTKLWICQDLNLTTLSWNQRWCQCVIPMSSFHRWRTITKWDVYLLSWKQEDLNILDISQCMEFWDKYHSIKFQLY